MASRLKMLLIDRLGGFTEEAFKRSLLHFIDDLTEWGELHGMTSQELNALLRFMVSKWEGRLNALRKGTYP